MSTVLGQPCNLCGKPGKKICSKCNDVGRKIAYCSKECQVKSWKDHKLKCGKAGNTQGNIPSKDVVTKPKFGEMGNLKSLYKHIEVPEKIDENSPVMLGTTLPLGDDVPGGSTQMMIQHGLKQKILEIPGFPKSLREFNRDNIAIDTSSEGKGFILCATKDFSVGELILDERALLIMPNRFTPGISVSPAATREQEMAIHYQHVEEQLEKLVRRMSLKDQLFFFTLHNAHKDGEPGPLYGRMRTNGLSARGLALNPEDSTKGDGYFGVCPTISRINHSCSPNATWTFDIESLSFQLWVTREIKKDEEITLSYHDTSKSSKEMKEWLKLYGFECDCRSCKDPTSAQRRDRIFNHKTPTDLTTWVGNYRLPENYILKPSLEKLKLIQEERLEEAEEYLSQIYYVFMCYLALGALEEAEKYAQILRTQKFRLLDGTPAGVKRKGGPRKWIEELEKMTDLKKHYFWDARKKGYERRTE